MKKILIVLLTVLLLSIPSVYAKEQLDDGWHIVVKNSEEERGKEWSQQRKEWAYYENGVETMRYSRLVGSHRGYGTAPENSLASFQVTKEQGYYAFETDVRFTKDNVGVLVHDEKINALARNNDLSTISSDTYVKDLTYNQLKSNYIFNVERLNHDGATVLSGYNTNRITSFEEMIDFVVANKMYVSIELKVGTKEQIESLVRITQEKHAHNYIRWISYYTDLLKYVRDFDEDENLGVIEWTSCDDVHDLYCGEEVEYYINKLKTSKNILWISHNTDYTPNIACAVNMPSNESSYPTEDDVQTKIPKSNVRLTANSTKLVIGKEKTFSYMYDGDGEVKCSTGNPSKLTCSVDPMNQEITITSVGTGSSEERVSVYATQGIATSASDDEILQVTIDTDKNFAASHVHSISIANYPIRFNSNQYLYQIAIKDETELDIDVDMDIGEYTYTISGNHDLQEGSIVTINVFNQDNEKVLIYQIKITKEASDVIVPIPDTFKGLSTILIAISVIVLTVGISVFCYHYIVQE